MIRVAATANSGATPDRREPVPGVAALLGGLGAVPFVAFAAATAVFDGAGRSGALWALLAYGAVILSFLGGIHWGFALAPGNVGRGLGRAGVARHLAASVLPALLAWAALLVPVAVAGLPGAPALGCALLAGGLLAVLLLDRWAARAAAAPSWWLSLRWPLSVTGAVAVAVAGVVA